MDVSKDDMMGEDDLPLNPEARRINADKAARRVQLGKPYQAPTFGVFKDKAPQYGYHGKDIPPGEFGEPSKVREETEEFLDAMLQGNPVMALCELADLYGAIRGFLAKHHPSVSMAQLETMADATERAFLAGHRRPKNDGKTVVVSLNIDAPPVNVEELVRRAMRQPGDPKPKSEEPMVARGVFNPAALAEGARRLIGRHEATVAAERKIKT